MDDKKGITSIIPSTSTALAKVGSIIKITNKIIFSEIEELFNEAFYLINSANSNLKRENFCFKLEYDREYLKRNKFKYLGNSDDDYKKAVALLEQIIKMKPNFKYAHWSCGIAKNRLGSFDSALTDFNKAVEIDPNYSYGYYSRGFCKKN
jgi:tetratricopeptide (TPR) repeat protein